MAWKPKFKRISLLDFYRLFLGLGILENILAGWYLFSLRSKTQNVFLAGFSLQRIAAGFAIFLVLAVYVFLLYDSIHSRKFLTYLASRLESILKKGVCEILIRSALIVIMVCSLARLLFYWLYMFPDYQRFVFFLSNNYIPWELETLPKILIGWVFLISLKILILDLIWARKASNPLSIQARLMVVSCTIEILVLLYFVSWSLITRIMALDILLGPAVKILILSVWFSVWAFLSNRKGWGERFFLGFTCISIWLSVFIVSLQFAQWFGAWNTPSINHFNLLADAFLHGKLYLSNPKNTGDLTFYKGHLFVAEPPFPAVLMLPFIAIWGVQAFNTTTFSLVLAGITAVTVYLILHRLIQADWIGLSRSGAIWITALFSFGTMYWWLSILSKVWFFSQVVTVLFCALAFLAAVNDSPAWVSGLCLGAAILCRPDVFTLWPALLAIAIQQRTKDGKVKRKDIAGWGGISAIPIILGAGLLLCYNFLRFGNFFDFGYVTINGGSYLLQQVQAYGLFSPHFIPENIHWMFLALPPLSAQCGYYLTRGWGMSMLITTPALLYLFRKFKISWWTVGCWCSILLSVLLLSMYSNNGALQYGYRYMMDFSIPVTLLIAYNAGERISAPLKALIIASIFINYYGTISWFVGPC